MSASKVLDEKSSPVDSAGRRAHDVVDTIEDSATRAIENGSEKVHGAVAALGDLESQAELTIEEASAKVAQYVREKPLQAAGVAFAAGVLTTMILRRR